MSIVTIDIHVNANPRVRFAMALACLLCALIAGPAHAKKVPAKVLSALSHSSVRVRIAAVVAVSKSGADNARQVLEKVVRTDKAAPVRAAALEGLERIGDPEALPTVQGALSDKSALVKKVARRAQAKLKAARSSRMAPTASGPAIPVDLSAVEDASGAGYPGLAALLQSEIQRNIEKNKRRDWRVSTSRLKKGYGLIARLKEVRPFSQDGVNGLESRCEMTVVKLPGKALRLSLRANAAAGVQGDLRDSSKPRIVKDGVRACAAALAGDFVEYAFSRPTP